MKQVAKKEIIARTIFASLMDALWPLALLKVSKVVVSDVRKSYTVI